MSTKSGQIHSTDTSHWVMQVGDGSYYLIRNYLTFYWIGLVKKGESYREARQVKTVDRWWEVLSFLENVQIAVPQP